MIYLDIDGKDVEKYYSYTDKEGVRRNDDSYCIYCGKSKCRCKDWKCGLYGEVFEMKESDEICKRIRNYIT